MNRWKYILSGCLLCPVILFAQSPHQPASETQQKDIVDKIRQASSSMKTMKCDFTQVKELSFMDEKVTSEGKMYYKQTDKIRWEYTKPYTYVFATDGKNVRMHSGNNTGSTVPVKSSKLFNEISNIMIGGVSGNGLIDSPGFSTQFGIGKDNYLVTLTPLKKEVKDLFSSICLYVDKTDHRIRTVELIEKNGDKTSIQLKNIQMNVVIEDEIFTR
jgi:outer membrane lipoprotein-sorting protein